MHGFELLPKQKGLDGVESTREIVHSHPSLQLLCVGEKSPAELACDCTVHTFDSLLLHGWSVPRLALWAPAASPVRAVVTEMPVREEDWKDISLLRFVHIGVALSCELESEHYLMEGKKRLKCLIPPSFLFLLIPVFSLTKKKIAPGF